MQLWERGERLRPLDRTLVLLARALGGAPPEALLAMTIGESEMKLLELRTSTFGNDLRAVAGCPDCRTLVELAVDPAVLLALRRPPPAHLEAPGDVGVDAGGWRLRLRLPTVGDLIALDGESDPARGRVRLLERCARVVETSEGPGEVADLPSDVQAAVARAFDDADPAAQITTTLECPSCHRSWEADVDVAAFLWREITVMARRLLREVHELASRYGWTERDILRLSATRRHAYLEGRWA